MCTRGCCYTTNRSYLSVFAVDCALVYAFPGCEMGTSRPNHHWVTNIGRIHCNALHS